MATVFIARRAGLGVVHFAGFLIDRWGFGLKDAFLHRAIPEGAVHERIEQARETGMAVEPADLVFAQQLVWGGVEFARRNGFRLPPEFEESKTLVGHLPEGVEIPWHLFGKDGKPLVIGDLDDILRRLDDRGPRVMPWDYLIRLPDDEE